MRLRSLLSPLSLLLLIIATIVFVRTSWISDDAMITFRSVLNFTHGFGPVFNLGERAQAFTHPLWFLLLSLGTWITSSIYYFTFTFPVLISICVVGLFLLWINNRQNKHWFVIVGLFLSKAFVDFSTSGLENPLFHLMLLAGFILGWLFLETKKISYARWSMLILFSTYLCRPDLLLLVSPFLFLLLLRVSSRSMKLNLILTAILPTLVWTLFSLVYYGFPFPNTAYAKLGMTVSQMELIRQGGIYLSDSLFRDPITLSVIGAGVVSCFQSIRNEIKAISIGIVVYLFYIVWIGGDFMSGRFLTAPLLASAFVLSAIAFPIKQRWAFLILLLVLGAKNIDSTILSGRDYTRSHIIPPSGIVDERGYWFQKNGWFTNEHYIFGQPPWNLAERKTWRICGNLGQTGLGMGPNTHLVDLCGLSEPLLARMPSYNFDGYWRIGHFYRQVPTNYEKAILLDDPSVLVDSSVSNYWSNLRVITHGPLFSENRIKMIAKMNLGLVPKPDFRMYTMERVPSKILEISELQKKKSSAPIGFYNSIEVELDKPTEIKSLSFLFVDPLETCTVTYEYKGKFFTLKEVAIRPFELNQINIQLPSPTQPTKRLRIEPTLTLEKPVSESGIGNFHINSL